MKAAIYSRKSKFTGKGESIENQVQLCKEYAQRIGITDYIIYEDEGFSGGNTERPRFQQLLKDAKNKKFNALICYRLDRISRNVVDFSTTLELLQDNNINFVSIREQFDTSTPMGRAMVYIASVFAQLERETIAERVRDNMLELSKSGRWLGGNPPLGFESKSITYYDNEMKEKTMCALSPVPKDIEIIKLIFDKYLELESIFQVTKYFDAHNIKLKNYKKTNPAFIGEILRNPVYATADDITYNYFKDQGLIITGAIDGVHGLMPYNRTNGEKKKKVISEWIIAVAAHEGIISGEKWVAAQRLKEKNSQQPPNLGKCNIVALSGLLSCAKCGSSMSVRYGTKRSDGERPYYYTCSNRILNITNCDNPTVRADILEDIVVENLIKLTSNESMLMKSLGASGKLADSDSLNEEFKNINAAIYKNELAIKNLVDQMAILSVDASRFLAQKIEELSKENQKLKKDLLNLENKKHNSNINRMSFELLIDTLINFPKAINQCETVEERKKLLGSIIDKVIWNGDTQKVKLKLLEI
jgi:DNA invertase Pin-like site-specific DNA recombinase